MKYFLSTAALFAASVAAECSQEGGNWYCDQVNAITYTGVGGSGSYDKITNMYPFCTSEPYGYSGSLAPLDEEVSAHFRGPLNLKQFAVYTPGQSSKKRSAGAERRHAHGHVHGHLHPARDLEERQVGAWVTATMGGQVVSWINEYSGEPTSAAAAAPAPAAASEAATSAAPAPSSYEAPSESAPASSEPTSAAGSIASSSGGWGRKAYYNADSGSADGLVFLNHYGAQGCSGTFDYTYGNSLSYASTNGQACASSAQTLADTTLPSDAEVVIMSDQPCEGDDCGYSREGTVAYHGWEGPMKAFFFEFQMPDEGGDSASEYDPVNMPAVWLLNAQIPRTLQYGNASCSCWTSGCGEMDIFEVLSPGQSRCKSTLHGNIAGGDSNYFPRPFDGPAKGALIMYNNNIHIKFWPSDTSVFPSTMNADTINAILGSTMAESNSVSLFNLAGAGSG